MHGCVIGYEGFKHGHHGHGGHPHKRGHGHHGIEHHEFGHHGFGQHGFWHHGIGHHSFGHHVHGHKGLEHHGKRGHHGKHGHHGFGPHEHFHGLKEFKNAMCRFQKYGPGSKDMNCARRWGKHGGRDHPRGKHPEHSMYKMKRMQGCKDKGSKEQCICGRETQQKESPQPSGYQKKAAEPVRAASI